MSTIAAAQTDSIKTQRLDAVTVEGQKLFTIERLPKIQGTYLWSGKKNEVINVQNLDANIAEKTPRQIFSKVPGVFVYDMDGTGNQMNISTRGLDPHRGWEFNVRKNGIITNSDMYGYPASHYSMPMEAVDHIEEEFVVQANVLFGLVVGQPGEAGSVSLPRLLKVLVRPLEGGDDEFVGGDRSGLAHDPALVLAVAGGGGEQRCGHLEVFGDVDVVVEADLGLEGEI